MAPAPDGGWQRPVRRVLSIGFFFVVWHYSTKWDVDLYVRFQNILPRCRDVLEAHVEVDVPLRRVVPHHEEEPDGQHTADGSLPTTVGRRGHLPCGPELLGLLEREDLAAVLAGERFRLFLPREGDQRRADGLAGAARDVEGPVREQLEPGRLIEDVGGVDGATHPFRFPKRA